jgi:phospholipase C
MTTHSLQSHARIGLLAAIAFLALICPHSLRADGDLSKVKHVIIIMQENHSFDNYFGALALAPGSPYHQAGGDGGRAREDHTAGCAKDDHSCVDGLSCHLDISGNFVCSNSNRDENGKLVKVFHDPRRCVGPDLDHGWLSTHREANFDHPNNTLENFLADGFVRVNDMTEQIDPPGVEDPTEDQTMNFYTQSEIPFYYDLAQKFAIDDRYFSSVLGPTFPNRSYLLAGTSFGHLTTSDTFPPTGGYKPITGTILDLLDKNHITWADYFQDAPQAATFRSVDPRFLPLKLFLAQAAAGTLPQVSFVDPNFGLGGVTFENDEHPPTDIQRGQAYVSTVVNAIRNGPNWQDSVIFITYDEHGGSYDHVAPPRARQGGQRNPDGISPGQCADLSNAPASQQPGGGAECHANFLSNTDTSLNDAIALCPALSANPTGPYPAECANFDQLGIRVPLIAVSPFSKRHYVSHTVGDHTSLLAFIEKRFMSTGDSTGHNDGGQDADAHDGKDANAGSHQHLTKRDQFANPLEDLFDFENAPSLGIVPTQAAPPLVDCTPK